MRCPRCSTEMPEKKGAGPWCTECENQYDTWVRRHATDILWQTASGALIAMAIGLGLPVLGFEPVIATMGVVAGASTFFGVRAWGKKRRRKQFLAGALPRAYLPSRTT